MADIELVIKVSEELYNRFGHEYRDENLISKYTNDAILDAFCNGTLLPKGHGRIIDETKISKCEQVGLIIKDGNITRCLATDAPTIIEADKGSEK